MSVPVPYHRFWFSNGFSAQPPPEGQFNPSSGKLLTKFTPGIGNEDPAQIGLGLLATNPCFRFDFQGFSIGCDGSDPECSLTVTGIQWDGTKDVITGSMVFIMPPCAQATSCELTQQIVDSDAGMVFTNLTAINVTAQAQGKTQAWWMDDLQIGWTNIGCDAARCRSEIPNAAMKRGTASTAFEGARRLLRFQGRRPLVEAN
jgi:hypothetical protein